jgi:hypothetical protein
MRALIVGGIGITTLITAAASAQHVPGGGQVPPRREEPYSIEAFGAFRDLIMQGDFTPKVAIGSVMARRPTTGVGAVSAARGEITVIDGKLIISYGKTDMPSKPDGETAALLATAKVKEWQSVRVSADIAPEAVGAFLAQSARAHGLDPQKSFPFQLRGTVAPYAMHVNIAPIDGPHGMGLPMAVTAERKGEEIAGTVAGLHASPALVGVVSHGGQRTHAHWVAADGRSTAHLDLWGIRAGATLLLPRPE